ncbi:MAG: hypothetical protein LBJ76_04055 [Candidatus Accumulibacter sp.]|jgi:hypothetical protein|nr:hypothetical protein [Accumulibacter sp.]
MEAERCHDAALGVIYAVIAILLRLKESFQETTDASEFKEGEHPRDEDGKFGSGGESGKKRESKREPKTVEFSGNELGDMNRPMKEIAREAMNIAREKFAGRSFEATDGSKIAVTWQGIKHGLSEDANPTKAIAVTKLGDILSNAKFVKTDKDYRIRSDIKAVHFSKTDATIGSKKTGIGIVVREHKDGNRYYDHFEAPGTVGEG